LRQGQSTKQYEDETKRRFIQEPANCKLLIVVSKLLTGFDAPSCSYIYLDNELHDHNLFQAICRTNRIDGDDKDYGYIVDFKELFGDVQNAIAVYNSDELDTDSDGGESENIQIKDLLKEGRAKLEAAREALKYLCEPVPEPREVEDYLHYFCGEAENPNALNETEALRISLYKFVATFVRAFVVILEDLEGAGYSADEIALLKKEVEYFRDIRAAIKKCAGEELDIRPYEADMRHLINTYIQADPASPLGGVDRYTLVELIIKTGIHDAIASKLNEKGKLSNKAIAESIINNVRKTIVREQLTDPKFYKDMSMLLDDLIKQRVDSTKSYEEFLVRAQQLVEKMERKSTGGHPQILNGHPLAIVLFNNLASIETGGGFICPENEGEMADLAIGIESAMREQAPAYWKGDEAKETQVLNALFPLLGRDREATRAVFEIVKNQKGCA